MKRKISIALMLVVVFLFSTYTTLANPKSYSDVNETSWYYKTVMKLSGMGAIDGFPDGKFYPNKEISRIEFVKIVVNTVVDKNVGKNTETGHWGKNYILAAVSSQLLKEEEIKEFDLDKPILRQEMAIIMDRAMEFVLKEDIIKDTAKYSAKIKDWSNTCESCKPSIAQAYAKGIIGGMPDGTFKGDKTATRAEAATMIVRLIDKESRLNTDSQAIIPDDKTFNPSRDVNDKGIMKIAKAEEYLLQVVKNMSFYKEGNKYYVKANLPQVPDGFELSLKIVGYFKDAESFLLTARPVRANDSRKIPNTGSFTREITGMKSVSSIDSFEIDIAVIKANQTTFDSEKIREGFLSIALSNPNKLAVIYENGDSTKYIDYDFKQIFKW